MVDWEAELEAHRRVPANSPSFTRHTVVKSPPVLPRTAMSMPLSSSSDVPPPSPSVLQRNMTQIVSPDLSSPKGRSTPVSRYGTARNNDFKESKDDEEDSAAILDAVGRPVEDDQWVEFLDPKTRQKLYYNRNTGQVGPNKFGDEDLEVGALR